MVKKNTQLPKRNIVAEITILTGAAGILIYGIVIFLVSFIANIFNDTSSPAIAPLSVLAGLFALNITIQGVYIFRESERVDHYGTRLGALALVLAFPLLMFIVNVSGLLGGLALSPASSIFSVLTLPCIAMSIAGSVWLWVLLTSGSKLHWELASGSRRSSTYKMTYQKMIRNKKLGFGFLIAPIVFLVVYTIYTFSVGSAGNGASLELWRASWVLRQLLIFSWLPCWAIGILFLANRK